MSRTSLLPAPRSHYDVTVRKVLAGNGIDRNVMLEQLRAKADRPEAVDLVVVGGGITGAGVALDAALRGFDVVLVERGDFASGTSSKSSKLVHGGLRYLQQGDVALVPRHPGSEASCSELRRVEWRFFRFFYRFS